MTEITGAVHHINVSVSNLDRSKEWYQRIFGLTELARLSDEAGGWSKVILRHSSGLLIGLTEQILNDAKPFAEWRCGFDHVALAVENTEMLSWWNRRLNELEIESSGIKTTPFGSLITFRDPDDVQFELYVPSDAGR